MTRTQQSVEIKVPARTADNQLTHGKAGQAAGQEVDTVGVLGTTQGTGQAGNNAGREGIDQVATLGTLEGSGQMSGEAAGRIADRQGATQGAQADPGSQRNSPVPAMNYAAGSEGWAGDEDPSAPVVSSSRTTAEQRNDAAGSVSPQQSASSPGAASDNLQENQSTQSENSLSRSMDEGENDGQFSVAEEVNLDQQSDAARHIGQMPDDKSADRQGGAPVADAMRKSLQQDRQDK
jgi:hypothetical protein